MDKPEKRTGYTKIRINDVLRALAFTVGWNDACEEWEKYHNFMMNKENFPTKEDLQKIIRDDIHSIIAEVISRHKGMR